MSIADFPPISQQLTVNEAKNMTLGPSISTITWMEGSPDNASRLLCARLRLIVNANPWLTGRLTKVGKGKLFLTYRVVDYSDEDMLSSGLFNPHPTAGSRPDLSSSMDYVTLCKTVAKTSAEIKPGSACINKNQPLTALSVFPDSVNPNKFAVMFSLSHVVVDGFNYYQLLGMLNTDSPILTLSPVRKHQIIDQAEIAMGPEAYAYAMSGATICNVVCGMMCGKKAIIKSYEVDDRKVDEEKGKFGAKAKGGYISTNDVISSSFANAVSARVFWMPLNYRNRLPDFTDADAGNYEGVITMGPGDYDSPDLIRNSLNSGPPTFKRETSNPLPSTMEAMRCRIAMLTNWTFPFFEELSVVGCTQILHLPHSDVSMVPFDVGVVYRPKKGKLAVTYFVRSIDESGLVKECPLGAEVKSADQYQYGGK